MAFSLLSHLENPNLALPLFLCGLFLIYLDFNLPGKVLPAALGTLFLSLSLYGLVHIPIRHSALLQLGCSVACILLDLACPTRNVLPAVGTAGLAYALFRLTDAPNASQHVYPVIAILTAAAFTVVTLKLGRIALLARRNKAVKAR